MTRKLYSGIFSGWFVHFESDLFEETKGIICGDGNTMNDFLAVRQRLASWYMACLALPSLQPGCFINESLHTELRIFTQFGDVPVFMKTLIKLAFHFHFACLSWKCKMWSPCFLHTWMMSGHCDCDTVHEHIVKNNHKILDSTISEYTRVYLKPAESAWA